VITYTASTGTIVNSSTSPLLPGTDGSGVAFDVSGNVYVAAFGADKVFKLNAAGVLQKEYVVGDGPGSLSTK
jgi:DNA-binding beta-propeller fold protein YncE